MAVRPNLLKIYLGSIFLINFDLGVTIELISSQRETEMGKGNWKGSKGCLEKQQLGKTTNNINTLKNNIRDIHKYSLLEVKN